MDENKIKCALDELKQGDGPDSELAWLRAQVKVYETHTLPLYLSWIKLLLHYGDFGDRILHHGGLLKEVGFQVIFSEEERKLADTWGLKIIQERPVHRMFERVGDPRPKLLPLPHLATVTFELGEKEAGKTEIISSSSTRCKNGRGDGGQDP